MCVQLSKSNYSDNVFNVGTDSSFSYHRKQRFFLCFLINVLSEGGVLCLGMYLGEQKTLNYIGGNENNRHTYVDETRCKSINGFIVCTTFSALLLTGQIHYLNVLRAAS